MTLTSTNNINTIDLEANSTFTTTGSNQTTIENYAKRCIVFAIFSIASPLIFCDFYFANIPISCQNNSNGTGVTLNTWLQVLGSVSIFYMIILIMGIFATEDLKFFVIIISKIIGLYSFAWIIVGCVLFFKYLEPSGTCDKTLTEYMWVRLISALVIIRYSITKSEE